jgi:RNA polymerase sigma factor (sigma-70 family)
MDSTMPSPKPDATDAIGGTRPANGAAETVFTGSDPAPIHDAELLRRFLRNHDDAAFEALVRRHERLVRSVCRRGLWRDQDAEDAFQGTFLALVRRAGDLVESEELSSSRDLAPWLFRAASFVVAATRRAERRHRRTPPLSLGELAGPRSFGIEPIDPSEGQPLAALEARWDLNEALAELSERDRRALTLCAMEGLSRSEAAERLGCPEGTLSATLARAKARLRGRLTGRGFGPAMLIGAGLALPGQGTATAGAAIVTWSDAATRRGSAWGALMTANLKLTLALATLTLGLVLGALGALPIRAQPSSAEPNTDPLDGPKPASASKVLAAPADAWTSFRGNPEMTGVAGCELPDKPELLWKFDSKDAFEATPAIVGGTVFIATMDGRHLALKLSDGSKVWQYDDPEKEGCKSSPLVTDELVVIGTDTGRVLALGRADGKLRWKFETKDQIVCSPTLVDGKILVGSYDDGLYALNPKDGAKIWELRAGGPIHCSPTLAAGQVFVAGCDGFLRLVSVADGKETKAMEVGGQIASTPARFGNRVFFGTLGNEVMGVDFTTMTKVWTFSDPERSFPFHSSPAVSEGLVFIGGRDKQLRALEVGTGNLKWSFNAGARVDSSPVVASGRVWFGTGASRVVALDLKTGQRAWEHRTDGDVNGSPAVAENRLVIGDLNGVLYCFGGK